MCQQTKVHDAADTPPSHAHTDTWPISPGELRSF